jgi:predicted O-methyltransferase YrrM
MKLFFSKKHQSKTHDIPGNATDKRISAIYSAYQQPGKPTDYLLKLGVNASALAGTIDLSSVSSRIQPSEVNYIDIFPGEHYQLVASITTLIKPKLVIELGTHLGYSSLCIKKALPADGKVLTFDVIPWNEFPNTILKDSDFDTQLEQKIDDVTEPEEFKKYKSVFEEADIVFMDALKDGVQEYKFLENFRQLNFKKKCLFIFDDIRLWNMLDIWYHMEKPKLDLTSFGHWSGTGLVEWN